MAGIVSGWKSILWVAETDIEVLVAVLVDPYPCTAYPSPPARTSDVDIVIALTTKPMRIVRHDTGPACVMNGQP